MKVTVTGIKPTGSPHLGNYLGMIQPALALAEQYEALYFIADYHALTSVRSGKNIRDLTYEVAATWLALDLATIRGPAKSGDADQDRLPAPGGAERPGNRCHLPALPAHRTARRRRFNGGTIPEWGSKLRRNQTRAV